MKRGVCFGVGAVSVFPLRDIGGSSPNAKFIHLCKRYGKHGHGESFDFDNPDKSKNKEGQQTLTEGDPYWFKFNAGLVQQSSGGFLWFHDGGTASPYIPCLQVNNFFQLLVFSGTGGFHGGIWTKSRGPIYSVDLENQQQTLKPVK